MTSRARRVYRRPRRGRRRGLGGRAGRRYRGTLPTALVRAAEGRGLPLVALHRETPFVGVTEAVHSLILDAQLDELRASERLHRTFTELTVEGADAGEIVRQTALIARRPIVLENLAHQVLAYDAAGTDAAELLGGWEQRSRAAADGSGDGTDSTASSSAPAGRTGAGWCSRVSRDPPLSRLRPCCWSAPPRRWRSTGWWSETGSGLSGRPIAPCCRPCSPTPSRWRRWRSGRRPWASRLRAGPCRPWSCATEGPSPRCSRPSSGCAPWPRRPPPRPAPRG